MDKTLQSPKFYLFLLENSNDLISIIDEQGNYQFVGGSVKAILGYSPEEMVGNCAFGYIHEEDRDATAGALNNALGEKLASLPYFRFRHKTGEWRWMDCTVSNMVDNPFIRGYVTNTRDITEKVEEERRKLRAQAHYESMFYNHPDAVFELHSDGCFTKVNSSVSQVLGYEDSQILGVHFSRFVHEQYLPLAMEAFVSTMQGNSRYLELQAVRQGEEKVYLGITIMPVIVEGEIVSIQGIAKDITLQRKLEEVEREQAEQLRNIMESVPESFFSLDQSWHFTYANAHYASYIGKSRQEIVGKCIKEVFPAAADLSTFYSECVKVLQTGLPSSFEELIYYGDGRRLSFQVFPSRNGVSVNLVDVTEKAAEKNRLEKLALVASKTTTGVVMLDRFGRIEWVNSAFEETTGYGLQEAYWQYPGDLLGGEEAEGLVQSKIRKKMAKGKPFKGEVVNYSKNGQQKRFKLEIIPVLGEDGQPVKYISIRYDVTEIRQKEDQLLKITRDLSEQIRNLQQFSYMVSHNLRAPAANIQGLVALIGALSKDTPFFDEAVSKLALAAGNLDVVIRDMNHILSIRERSSLLKTEAVNVLEVCEEALSCVLPRLKGGGHTISLNINKNFTLSSNRVYLLESLKQLFSNAVKFRQADKELMLEVNLIQMKGKTELTIRDNGIGMDISLGNKDIFQLYKRFHQGYEGRGVGLFLVRTYLEELGATIRVESAPAQGTTFTLKFKCHA
ncbi:PAS domain S-box-containing protein [Pontibacter aydingkolensis]|uniref:histidine kinase n=1 Tax=Pontibacter aydingkolensis TaxID=1911536 RepID=A0ABS7CYG8_9BACT|nr:PAS domain-containing sensor histidine kinase [Pontibacter aydingkolensis]MBW7468906.1 PAS domain-containing sensor histidine kinase [Pontibacter aydingkolensis]